MARKSLPNGCECTIPAVHPKNWNKPGVSLIKDWSIHYRFYDGSGQCKRVLVKNMNHLKACEERRQLTKQILAEINRMLEEGYNPIEQRYSTNKESLTVPQALDLAFSRLQCGAKTNNNIRCALIHIKRVITVLGMHSLPIRDVRRKDLIFILDKIGETKGGWTAPNFNHYRTHLIMLFNELKQLELTEIDLSKIRRMKEIKKIRETLTPEQRIKVNSHLKENYYTFWRFINIFFHSGSRVAELVRVRTEDVDLANQRFKLIILKGAGLEEVWKSIKDIALPFWNELMTTAKRDNYIFSKNLEPGETKINEHQITKRWRLHVKQKLGITADMYSLKHSNTTEVVDLLSEEVAASINSHKGTGMVRKIYDTGREKREHEKIKRLDNKFA